MEPTFVIVGRITREYILPPVGQPLLDSAGGSALYASGGLILWDKSLGLLARIGEDYPRPWLKEIESRGADIQGIQILKQSMDLRDFHAYNENFEITRGTPVSQFARRELTFPKALLGYQIPVETERDGRKPDPLAPLPADIPVKYREARAVHLCPMDFVSHNQLFTAFKAGSASTITLDPSVSYMSPSSFRDLRVVLSGLTAFLPSEEELRGLFWGDTHDLWEMAAAVGAYGCEIVVVKRGGQGQLIYDVPSKRKWEVPAYPARLADPTGAGDAFCGGFLAGYQKTFDPLQAALYGNVSASLKMEGSGAFYPLDVFPGLAEARLNALQELVRTV
ncbi:MAG TPA: carbohydrate kinase family protein [Anaerolineales bacterium]|nr:carbohydrate kinase family protein [Anaerolineales bacterium]